MKKKTKITLFAAAAILLAAGLAIVYFSSSLNHFGKKREINDIGKYKEAFAQEGSNLPALPADDRLGKYIDVDFLFKESVGMIISMRWYRIDLQFDAAEYETQKAYLNDACDFIEQTGHKTNGYAPTFSYRGYSFHTETEIRFPKELSFVGFNDAQRKICLIRFEDADLDDASDFPIFFEEHGFLD